MDKSKSLNFEVTKEELFWTLAAPVLVYFVGAIFLVGVAGLVSYLQFQDMTVGYREDMYQSTITGLSIGGAVSLVMIGFAIAFTLNRSARRVTISDDVLKVDTNWRNIQLRWSDVADVIKIKALFRTYLAIKTWDGDIINLSPPLSPADSLENEIRARAIQAISAPPNEHQRSLADRKRDLWLAECKLYILRSFCSIGVIAAFAFVYLVWHQTRNPSLDILGTDVRHGDVIVQTGKHTYIQSYGIWNFGRTCHGLEIEISGPAMESRFMQNPQVLIVSRDRSKLAYPAVIKNQIRLLLRLEPSKNNTWIAKAASIPLKHRADVMVESLEFFAEMAGDKAPSEYDLNVELYADVLKKGRGILKAKLTPIECPSSATEMESLVIANGQNDRFGGANSAPCAGMPEGFPVSVYPGSEIDCAGDHEVKLVAPAKTYGVLKYYTAELKGKGWNVKCPKGTNEMSEITASKQNKNLSVRVYSTNSATEITIENERP